MADREDVNEVGLSPWRSAITSDEFWDMDILDNIHILQREFEDTKWVIRIRKSKDRQYNGQNKTEARTNNDIHNIMQKTKG
jgi:hypothetical protein